MPPYNAPSWKELVLRCGSSPKFARPAGEDHIAATEKRLGARFPLSLRDLLLETDGVTGDYGVAVIWSVAEIERQNVSFRTNDAFRDVYMLFDNLLFVGEEGGGDLFAFAIQADGGTHKDDIYRWEHETDARSWSAPRLENYLEQRLRPEGE